MMNHTVHLSVYDCRLRQVNQMMWKSELDQAKQNRGVEW